MKIAMFGHKRIPSREGGVEIVVEQLAARMVGQGHSVTCYNRAGHHVSGAAFDTRRLSAYRGIRLRTVPTLDKKGLAAVTSSLFAALCAAFSGGGHARAAGGDICASSAQQAEAQILLEIGRQLSNP